jgi:hypothetical protein
MALPDHLPADPRMSDHATTAYPRLASLVAGRRVDVLCAKGSAAPRDAGLLVRFNADEAPADIWATAFFGEIGAALARSARVIVGTTPPGRWEIQPHGWHKDFSTEKADYMARAGLSDDRIEQVDAAHWRALQARMPALPMSGLVLLSMLEKTPLERCVIHGMTFYASATTPLRDARWHGDVHDLSLAALWLRQLLRADPRFEFDGDIDACVEATQARIADARRALTP